MDIKIESKEIRCPVCEAELLADVYEYESETGIPTKHGFFLFCTKTGISGLEVPHEWSYDKGISLSEKAYRWMREKILSGDLSKVH